MRITIERIIPFETAIATFRSSPYDNTGDEFVFMRKDAVVRVADVHPNEINPGSLYVVRNRLDRIRQTREAFFDQHGIDIFHLPCVMWYSVEGHDEVHRIAPPFIDISPELVQFVARPGESDPPPLRRLR